MPKTMSPSFQHQEAFFRAHLTLDICRYVKGCTSTFGCLSRYVLQTKSEADARKEEMRQLIAMRQAESPFKRVQGDTPQKSTGVHAKDAPRLQEGTATVETLVVQSERELKRAAANQELLQADL